MRTFILYNCVVNIVGGRYGNFVNNCYLLLCTGNHFADLRVISVGQPLESWALGGLLRRMSRVEMFRYRIPGAC